MLYYCEKCGCHMDVVGEITHPEEFKGMKVCRFCDNPVVPSDSLRPTITKGEE